MGNIVEAIGARIGSPIARDTAGQYEEHEDSVDQEASSLPLLFTLRKTSNFERGLRTIRPNQNPRSIYEEFQSLLDENGVDNSMEHMKEPLLIPDSIIPDSFEYEENAVFPESEPVLQAPANLFTFPRTLLPNDNESFPVARVETTFEPADTSTPFLEHVSIVENATSMHIPEMEARGIAAVFKNAANDFKTYFAPERKSDIFSERIPNSPPPSNLVLQAVTNAADVNVGRTVSLKNKTKSQSQFNKGTENIQTVVIPPAKTYADATNLAVCYPELAEEILLTPLSSARRSKPQAASTTNLDTPGWNPREAIHREKLHSPEAPNWALAPDNIDAKQTKSQESKTKSKLKVSENVGVRTPDNEGRRRRSGRRGGRVGQSAAQETPSKESSNRDTFWKRPLHCKPKEEIKRAVAKTSIISSVLRKNYSGCSLDSSGNEQSSEKATQVDASFPISLSTTGACRLPTERIKGFDKFSLESSEPSEEMQKGGKPSVADQVPNLSLPLPERPPSPLPQQPRVQDTVNIDVPFYNDYSQGESELSLERLEAPCPSAAASPVRTPETITILQKSESAKVLENVTRLRLILHEKFGIESSPSSLSEDEILIRPTEYVASTPKRLPSDNLSKTGSRVLENLEEESSLMQSFSERPVDIGPGNDFERAAQTTEVEDLPKRRDSGGFSSNRPDLQHNVRKYYAPRFSERNAERFLREAPLPFAQVIRDSPPIFDSRPGVEGSKYRPTSLRNETETEVFKPSARPRLLHPMTSVDFNLGRVTRQPYGPSGEVASRPFPLSPACKGFKNRVRTAPPADLKVAPVWR